MNLRFLLVCIVILLLTNTAKAKTTLTQAVAASSGTVCLGPEVPLSMNTPAIFMSLDNSNKKKVSDKVGEILFANVDTANAHVIRVSENSGSPIKVLLDFKKLKTNRAMIWKNNDVWRIGPAGPQACESTPQLNETAYHTPAKGTRERQEILDTIRPAVQKHLGKSVVFVVRAMPVSENDALVLVYPSHGDQTWDWVFALLDRKQGRWHVREVNYGNDAEAGESLDKWQKAYPSVPKELFDEVSLATNAPKN